MTECVAGDQCRRYDRHERRAAWTNDSCPLCPACLQCGGDDCRRLVYDFIDLEQRLHIHGPPAEFVTGTREPPSPLALGIDAIQRAILLHLTTWEEIVREHAHLSAAGGKVRDGFAVQRAVTVLAPRMRLLAGLPATDVMPWGPDGESDTQTGAQAILIFSALHRRSARLLGITQLTHALPGHCEECKMPTLCRDNGGEVVYCARCRHKISWDDYQNLVALRDIPEERKAS